MRGDDPAAGGGDAGRWRGPRDPRPRPTRNRNGALLLVLVALVGVMALVDGPAAPGQAWLLPGTVRHLPSRVGITELPSVTRPAPDGPRLGGLSAGVERLAEASRRHPLRRRPRPPGSGWGGETRGAPGRRGRPSCLR